MRLASFVADKIINDFCCSQNQYNVRWRTFMFVRSKVDCMQYENANEIVLFLISNNCFGCDLLQWLPHLSHAHHVSAKIIFASIQFDTTECGLQSRYDTANNSR